MPTWKSVRELNDTECSAIENRYIYIYGYIRLSLLEKREKHFSSESGRFLSGSGIFRIYIGKLFRSRERNYFVLFRSFKLEKRKKLRFSRPHSVKSY